MQKSGEWLSRATSYLWTYKSLFTESGESEELQPSLSAVIYVFVFFYSIQKSEQNNIKVTWFGNGFILEWLQILRAWIFSFVVEDILKNSRSANTSSIFKTFIHCYATVAHLFSELSEDCCVTVTTEFWQATNQYTTQAGMWELLWQSKELVKTNICSHWKGPNIYY